MSLVATDWSIDRSTGNIRYGGDAHTGASPSYATVIEFHRWLQSLADDAVATGDDELDITNTNPSQRSTDNIITLINSYNIDDTASQHLYDGSIIQNGGDDIYDGIVNFGNADVQIQIIQNGAVLSTDWWNQSGAGLNADSTSGISHRFMLNVRSGGTDVDNRKLIGTCRRFGYTYSEFTINATARGNNVLALTDSSDLNNQSAETDVSGWSSNFTNTEGYTALDIDNNGSNEHYYSDWNIDEPTRSVNDFYEYAKYVTRDGTADTIYGISGELFRGITHKVNLNTAGSNSGTFSAVEAVSWSTGTGQMFAIDNTTAASSTTMWIQLLTGTAPGTGVLITGTTSSATATTTSSSATEAETISKPFCGASTGSNIIGAYGLGIEPTDLTSSDQLSDLEGDAPKSPPNYVTNTVSGLVAGDRVLVAPYDGSSTDTNGDPAINKSQMTLSATLTSATTTSVSVSSIPSGSYPPASGYLRVTDDSGYEHRLHYSSYSGTTFTIDTADGNEDFSTTNATSGNDVYFAYIDEATASTSSAFTSVHAKAAASMDLVVLVRNGGASPIKQYIAPWTQSDTSSSTSAIRTSDT